MIPVTATWRRRLGKVKGGLGWTGTSGYYFISPDGNDTTGTGSFVNPWKTIAKADTVVTAGNTVWLRGGTYTMGAVATEQMDTSNGTAGNYITWRPFPGETPVITTATDQFAIFQMRNVGYHRLLNLTFRHDINRSSGISALTMTGVSNSIIDGCTFYSSVTPTYQQMGIHMITESGTTTSQNNVVQNCTFHDMGGEAVYLRCYNAGQTHTGHQIIRNTFYNMTINEFIQQTGITGATPTNCEWAYNNFSGTCTGMGGTHMVLSGTKLHDNYFNQVYLTGTPNNNASCVYAAHQSYSTAESYIYNNLIREYTYTGGSAFSVAGIYIYDLAVVGLNIYVYHNTIYKVANPGSGTGFGLYIYFNKVGPIVVKNNIISECENQISGYGTTPVTIDYNNLYGTTTTTGTNAQTGDPAFVDKAGGDFRLTASSPAGVRDSGVGGLTNCETDYAGVTRDVASPSMGAYEYVA